MLLHCACVSLVVSCCSSCLHMHSYPSRLFLTLHPIEVHTASRVASSLAPRRS